MFEFEVYLREDKEFKNPIKVFDVKEYKGYPIFLVYNGAEFKYIQAWRFKMKNGEK